MNDIIARRTLEFLENDASHPESILLEIGRPEPAHDGRDWGAPYRLTGAHCDGKVRYGYGSDSLEALICVLHLVTTHVEVISNGGGKLFLDGSEDLGLLPATT